MSLNGNINLKKKKKSCKHSVKHVDCSIDNYKTLNLGQSTSRPIEHKISKFLFEKRANNKILNSKLKHNKSCEGGMWGDSLKKPTNIFDDSTQSTNMQYSIMNEINDNKKKTKNDINTTNGYVNKINNKQKGKNSKTQQNNNLPLTQNEIITNLHTKNYNFRKIEESIIDKNFEKGIERDEIILNGNKNINDNMSNSNGNDEIKRRIILNNKSFDEKENEIISDNYEEYNNEYENLKDDFNLLYTNDYVKSIDDQVLHLELSFLLEKIIDLQDAYHKQLNMIRKENFEIRKTFNKYSDKYININKKYLKLKLKKERMQVLISLNTFIDNHKIKSEKEIAEINKEECKIWNGILTKVTLTNNKNNKDMMYNIFEKICGKNVLKLNNVEQIITNKLLNNIAKKKVKKQQNNNNSNSNSNNNSIIITKSKVLKSGSDNNINNKINFNSKGSSYSKPPKSSTFRHYSTLKQHKTRK